MALYIVINIAKYLLLIVYDTSSMTGQIRKQNPQEKKSKMVPYFKFKNLKTFCQTNYIFCRSSSFVFSTQARVIQFQKW